MPRLTSTDEYVVVKLDEGYGVAPTVASKHGVTVVERPVYLSGGDALDAITIVKALNASLKGKK
jgi:hypothetical protein